MEDGILLLSERKVQSQLRRLRRLFAKESPGELAKWGLCRMLFSVPQVDEEGKLAGDGFSLEKYCTGKGTEYKFWDKLKACELLMKLEEMLSCKGENTFEGILSALQQGATGLSDANLSQESGEEREGEEE